MLSLIQKYWWSLALRGLFLLVFGLIAVTAPNMTSETLVLYLGFFMASVGAVFIFVSIMIRKSAANWLAFLFFALVDLLVAYWCVFRTYQTVVYFVSLIAIWALLMGLALFWVGLTQKGMTRVLLFINGSLSVGFGVLIYTNPLNMTSINFMLGFYTILLSMFILYVSFRLRSKNVKSKLTADLSK